MGPRVDRTALRFNQACIIAFSVLAFVLGDGAGRWIVVAVAVVLLAGTAWEPLSLFKQAYQRVLVPARLLSPGIVPDDPAPHRFAQGLGGVFLAAAAVLLFAGVNAAGWVLTWLVVALAAVNILFGFCLGCFFYFQLGRAGLGPRPAGTR